MYPITKEELIERHKTACDLKQEFNLNAIEKLVHQNYLALKLKPKPVRMVGSLKAFRDQVKTQSTYDSTWVSIVCIGAYEIDEDKKKEVLDIYYPIFQAMENGLWLYAYLEDGFLCLPMPKVKTINGNVLHCATGPAFQLPEQDMYFLNGVYVTKELVMTPAEQLDPSMLFKEANVEVRREIVRKIGIERVVQKLGAEVIDKKGDYELLLLDLQDGRKREFLKMKNPSIGVYHIEGVPPGTKTIQEALRFRNGINNAPEILT